MHGHLNVKYKVKLRTHGQELTELPNEKPEIRITERLLLKQQRGEHNIVKC